MDKLPSPNYPPGRPGISIKKLHSKKVKLLRHPISDRPQHTVEPQKPHLPGF